MGIDPAMKRLALVRGETASTRLGAFIDLIMDEIGGDDYYRMEMLAEEMKMSAIEKQRMLYVSTKLVSERGKKTAHMALRDHVMNGTPLSWVNEAYMKTLKSENFGRFPVSGQDLLNLGFVPGPKVGNTMRAIKEHWFTTGMQATKEELLKDVRS